MSTSLYLVGTFLFSILLISNITALGILGRHGCDPSAGLVSAISGCAAPGVSKTVYSEQSTLIGPTSVVEQVSELFSSH